MDLATIVGLAGGIAMIILAMVIGGDISIFYNLPSVLIVVIGSLFVTMQHYTLEQYLNAGKIAGKAYSFKLIAAPDLIKEIVEIADAARKGGLLSLEGREVGHPFLSKGIQLLVDGHDADVIRTIMSRDMKLTTERHEAGADIFGGLQDVAPAMGMMGTLIGLVGMLANMDDPQTIGPAMAVALLTTLYGSIMATIVFGPIKQKCLVRTRQEETVMRIIIDGLLAIQGGQNPRIIDEMLQTYLPGRQRPVEEVAA